MDTRESPSFPRTFSRPFSRTPVALGILTAIVYAAGFAMVAAWFALLVLDQGRAPAATVVPPRTVSFCSVCGVVEAVREVAPAPGLQLRGTRDEGAVLLVAALGGASMNRLRPAIIYETSVVHDDGSVRVLRDTSAPHWKRGDRVKVIKGQVEPVLGEVAAR
jgi:hypothetical protein